MIKLWKTDKWGFAAVSFIIALCVLWFFAHWPSFVIVAFIVCLIASVIKIVVMLGDRYNW